jgi:hypothetical protein
MVAAKSKSIYSLYSSNSSCQWGKVTQVAFAVCFHTVDQSLANLILQLVSAAGRQISQSPMLPDLSSAAWNICKFPSTLGRLTACPHRMFFHSKGGKVLGAPLAHWIENWVREMSCYS